MVNFSTRIPATLTVLLFLDLFLSSYTCICSTMSFPPLGISDHVVVSVSIDFPSYWQWNAPFHRIADDYSQADCDGLCDHFRDVPWEDIFKLSASTAASEFCGWVQVGTDLFPLAAGGGAIVHRNHYFHLYQQNKSPESKAKLRQASSRYKRVLETAKTCKC